MALLLWFRSNDGGLANAILAERKLTQAEAARLPGVNQPNVSALERNQRYIRGERV